MLYFENSRCMNCGMTVGYCVELAKIVTLQHQTGSSQGSVYEVFFPNQGLRHYRQCKNGSDHDACNWLVPAESQQQFCNSCRLSEVAPDLSDTNNRVAWRRHRSGQAPAALHAVLAQAAGELARRNGRTRAWPSISSRARMTKPVMTGHDEGVITLNIDEADFAFRENMREKMGEAYRTVLGHLRHEIGHYYWDRLIRDSSSLRRVPRALRRRHAQTTSRPCSATTSRARPRTGADSFISAYATMHPWEDWAETWAHYLHMVDTLETAKSHGLTLRVPGAEQARRAHLHRSRWRSAISNR